MRRNADAPVLDLQTARGAAFVSLLKEIANHPAYTLYYNYSSTWGANYSTGC